MRAEDTDKLQVEMRLLIATIARTRQRLARHRVVSIVELQLVEYWRRRLCRVAEMLRQADAKNT